MPAIAQLIDAYLTGPQSLRQAVAGMSREQLVGRPIAGKWSTLEVICHLVDSNEAWMHRMKRVIAEERPLLIGFDESRFAAALAYHEREPEEELSLFEQGRRHMGRILRSLPAEAWSRTGIHSERGLITLEEHLRTQTEHVRHHLKSIAEKRRALGFAG